jgi:DNA ligase D-like protein (predicted ligase)
VPRHRFIQLNSLPTRKAEFIVPMDCLPVSRLGDGPEWMYEIKLDGYRAIAVKSGRINLYSRRKKSFNSQYPFLVEALSDLPDDTVVDGEVVALDDTGRPKFHLLQQCRSHAPRIRYFIFDLLVFKGHDLTGLPLTERRKLLCTLKLKSKRIGISDQFNVSARAMLAGVRTQELEGVVAKRKDSRYESGKRSGTWTKYRVNRSQEFVIGGFIPGSYGVDSMIVGYYRGEDLYYVARVRNGFVPASRRMVYGKLKPLTTDKCPFVNLPDEHPSRWGENLTAEKVKQCIWAHPNLVAVVEFLEWTDADRLRHSKFVGLREDKDAREVVKEHAADR